MSATNRLALLVNADGTRWVTRVDGRRVPKTLVLRGNVYTTIMTMGVEHISWAQLWLWDSPNGYGIMSLAPNAPRLNIVA